MLYEVITLLHGSQGCSTYMRRYLISHFKEPVDIASSNFTEETAVFGGGANLKLAIENVARQYAPAMIGIATTCLSETIGDDVQLILNRITSYNVCYTKLLRSKYLLSFFKDGIITKMFV